MFTEDLFLLKLIAWGVISRKTGREIDRKADRQADIMNKRLKVGIRYVVNE